MQLFPGRTSLACISLWRPWADFVALGWKRIETRTHQRFAKLAGERIGIQAAQTWDSSAIIHASRWLTQEQMEIARKMNGCDGKSGTILCTALAAHHRQLFAADSRDALISCSSTVRFGLELVSLAPSPISGPVKGRQGIFYVPLPVDAEVIA